MRCWSTFVGVVLGAVLLQAAGSFDAREVSAKKTDDLLLMCTDGGEPCRAFVNDVLKTLNVTSVIQPARNYKGCAPAPLTAEQVDQIVLWLLSRAQLATGYAAEDIGAAAQDLWPCK